MVQAGNFNKLAQMREQAFYADATAQLARAQHQAVAERERLTRLLGLSGEQLASRCPSGCPTCRRAGRAEGRRADRDGQAPGRADGQASTERTPESLGLTKATRFSTCSSSATRTRARPASRAPTATRSSSSCRSSTSARPRRACGGDVHAGGAPGRRGGRQRRSEVRESYSAYRTSFDLAKHYRDEVVPLRKRISERTCFATTACSSASSNCSPMPASR